MAGLYIHIPFCKSRCIYCGFYSSTHEELKQRYVHAIAKEMNSRREAFIELSNEQIKTVYLGGGTPSQLSEKQLEFLFNNIYKVYHLQPENCEITMECNPDDVTDDFARLLPTLGVNRVSMGAQTFSDARLRFLHRRHTARQVTLAVERLRRAGIGNISIDLIYGFPNETRGEWQADLEHALRLNVEHLSAYSLMFEEGTALYRMLEQGKVKEADEELSRQMYYSLKDQLEAAGYEHYEISNFARPGRRSRHNSSYWQRVPYLGIGAAAHSYDLATRRWNVADLHQYIQSVEEDKCYYEFEVLNEQSTYNDLVMTALRTCEGLPLQLLTDKQRAYCLAMAQSYIESGLLLCDSSHLRLTRNGLFVSDMIMADLMLVD